MGEAPATKDVIDRVDRLMETGNLTTRAGLSLIVSVYRDGMMIVSGFDERMRELEEAYVRFTNTMSQARDLEAANKKALDEILPTFRLVKWVGLALGTLIIGLIWALLTGKADVTWR